jgi:hypothetical protein
MGTYAVGTGALTLLRRLGSNVFGNKQIFAWAVWDRTLSDDELSEVTTNPWQLFKAPSQIFWPSLPDGAATYDMPFTLSVGTSLGFSRNSSRYRTYSISTSGTPSSSQDSTMYLSETLNVGVSVDSSMGQRVEINESLGVGASPSLVKQVSKAFSVAAGAVVTSAQQLPITIVGGIRRGAKLLGSFFGRGSL